MEGNLAGAIPESVERVFLGNPPERWLTALGVAVGVWLSVLLVRALISRRLRALAARTENILDDLVLDLLQKETRTWFIAGVAVFAGTLALQLPPRPELILRKAVILVAGLQALLWGSAAVDYYLRHSPRFLAGGDRATASTYGIISFIAKVFVVVVVLLLTLHNLGINVTALVAGLGVGGVAVALALQNILGDLFASMSIVLDKPFEVGDAIAVDGLAGTVEAVGLKTTRVRSQTGEQLVFSNADLLRSRIRNYKRMTERRMTFTLGVTYDTPRDLLAAIPGMLRASVEAQPGVRFDRAHLLRFGSSAIEFETAYFVLTPDFNRSMDAQQAVHLAVAERFARAGVEFAFPTTTVLLARKGEPPIPA